MSGETRRGDASGSAPAWKDEMISGDSIGKTCKHRRLRVWLVVTCNLATWGDGLNIRWADCYIFESTSGPE